MIKKLHLVYWPLLMAAVGFVLIYSFLNWMLVSYLKVLSLKDDVANIWLPVLFSVIIVFIWLRPRFMLVMFKSGKGNLPYLLILIATLTIAIPTIIAQSYFKKATGKFTKVWSINYISSSNPARYYKFKQFFIDKKDIGVYPTFEVSGRSNENLDIELHVVLPILERESDTIYYSCLGWIGIKFQERISNRLSDSEKELEYNAFVKKTQEDFQKTDFSHFNYLERLGNNADNDAFTEAVKTSRKSQYGPKNVLVFYPVNVPFEQRTGNRLMWLFISFAIGSFIFIIALLFAKVKDIEYDLWLKGLQSEDEVLNEVIEILKPRKGYFVTPVIIYMNILVFVVMALAGLGFMNFKPIDLFNWGGNFGPAVLSGDWWRLVTSVFLHGGALHLITNMFALMYVGIMLEPLLGKIKFLLVYLITGILASCVSMWWSIENIKVGASGAIFGLYGIFLALLVKKSFVNALRKQFLISVIIFIGYNLLVGFSNEGIDNAAHIGGLLSGFLAGLIIAPSLKSVAEVQTINDVFNPKQEISEPKTEMTRADYVAICRQCQHKKLDLNLGIICRQSGKAADFERECPEFEEA
ncbi:MAG TPA: rhomboid family intramembrane serine protease [Lentimicrobium sp.]|nr:rhomboid family intramembrane serine protease [Lentimicrobium sp.]